MYKPCFFALERRLGEAEDDLDEDPEESEPLFAVECDEADEADEARVRFLPVVSLEDFFKEALPAPSLFFKSTSGIWNNGAVFKPNRQT